MALIENGFDDLMARFPDAIEVHITRHGYGVLIEAPKLGIDFAIHKDTAIASFYSDLGLVTLDDVGLIEAPTEEYRELMGEHLDRGWPIVVACIAVEAFYTVAEINGADIAA